MNKINVLKISLFHIYYFKDIRYLYIFVSEEVEDLKPDRSALRLRGPFGVIKSKIQLIILHQVSHIIFQEY
jgi:hypothetical protein